MMRVPIIQEAFDINDGKVWVAQRGVIVSDDGARINAYFNLVTDRAPSPDVFDSARTKARTGVARFSTEKEAAKQLCDWAREDYISAGEVYFTALKNFYDI